MSCREKAMHALGECDCFKPCDFTELLERELLWFRLLMRLARHRVDNPEGMDSGLINLMFDDRSHLLRN
jgi:hypothetical protein